MCGWGWDKILKKENVPEKLDSKQLILRHILMRLQNLREKININYVSKKAEKLRVALDFSIAAFTIIWR